MGDPNHSCECNPRQIQLYRNRVSGPLLDRLDLHVEAPAVPFKDLAQAGGGLSSAWAREMVGWARDLQTRRFKGRGLFVNAQMGNRHLKEFAPLKPEVISLLEKAVDRLGLSARAYARVVKIARTIADLDGQKEIGRPHLAEAIGYRSLDRQKRF